jgi:glucokinase
MTDSAPIPAQRPRLLAADVGGTKTDLGVFTLEAGPRAPLLTGRLPSAQHANLASLARAFLDEHGVEVECACFAVAGPVVGGHAKLINLPWALDEGTLARALGIEAAWLLNDLLATATAVPALTPGDLVTLNVGEPVPGGTIAVIAPGTGLGEAFLTWDGARYRAYPSEGGHASFGPTTPTELELCRYLAERFGHVSYERVCSGLGIANVYRFHRDRADAPESPAIAAKLAQTAEPEQALVIVDAALDPETPDALCALTLATFVSVLGSETANLILKVLATGGVYVAGGIPPRILPALRASGFLAAARSKGRFAALIARTPIHVVVNPQVALLGAASHGLERMRAIAAPRRR